MSNEKRSLSLASTIEAKMKERGLSRVEFAETMKVTPSTITKWLKGNHNFTIKTLFEIEKVLQFTVFNLTVDNDESSGWSWYIKKNRRQQKG